MHAASPRLTTLRLPCLLAMAMALGQAVGCSGGTATGLVTLNAQLPNGTHGNANPTPAGGSSTKGMNPAPAITWVGRTQAEDAQNANVRFSWAGVSFGVHFTGTQLGVIMNDLPISFEGAIYDSFYDVMVDGQAGTTFSLTTAPQTISVVHGLPSGEHTVWVTKRTESMIGSGEFHGVDLGNDGNLLAAPAAPTHHIEMIGASADVGFGDTVTNCTGFQPGQEDESLAWPQLTANAVGAQLFNLSYSGKGLVNNLDPSGDPINILPHLYQEADTNVPNSTWDFSKWKADVVLIDLGANDLAGQGGTLDLGTFVPAYVTFIQQIQGYYPGVHIYLVINATDSGSTRGLLEAALQQVVAACQSMSIANVKMFEASLYTGNVFGCDGHPSAAVHQQMANEIVPLLQTDMGW